MIELRPCWGLGVHIATNTVKRLDPDGPCARAERRFFPNISEHADGEREGSDGSEGGARMDL